MYPPNTFNQVIQQELKRGSLAQVIIELHETFGDKNRIVELPIDHIDTIEYVDGVLTVRYYEPKKPAQVNLAVTLQENYVISRIWDWSRIREITFSDKPFLESLF